MIHNQQTKWTKYNYIQHRCILQNNAEQNILDTKEYNGTWLSCEEIFREAALWDEGLQVVEFHTECCFLG